MGFLYSQLVTSLPSPNGSYAGKTVVVTGSNVGLGKEAARHFSRLGAERIILAVRNVEKGKAAADDIIRTTRRDNEKGFIQVWKLDMSSYASVQQFVKRAESDLPRIDIFIANAGVAPVKFTRVEGEEEMITVNVVSTFLLSLLMMPKLQETARKFGVKPTLTITSSEVQGHTTFPQMSAPDGQIFKSLNDEANADMEDRYPVSKLLEVFGVRAFAERHPSHAFPVTLNCVNPGLCHSELSRHAGFAMTVIKTILARSTEQGSRTLVHAASLGPESHGHYVHDCQITLPSQFVMSAEGKTAQDRVWDELLQKLEKIHPGI
ncbi:MAG: hypothetical protein Q9198_009839, partial [Flavoplaca austrocitrina]